MKQFTPVIYKGVVIFRNDQPGDKLPYYARTGKGQLCADTLRGIKQLITATLTEVKQ